MYTPNIFPNDIFSLWGKEGSNNHSRLYEAENRRQHNLSTNNHANHHNQNGSSESNDQAEEQRVYLRSLFAPPLVAYSAEYPGASLSQLEYTIKTQSSGGLNTPLLTPLTQRKLERARRIRNLGYSTIVPIGIDKTMERIDYEESRRHAMNEQEDQSFIQTAENSTSNNMSTPAQPADSSGIGMNNSTLGEQREEVDLDAQIINSDEYHQVSDNFDSDDDDDEADAIGNTRYEATSDDEQDIGFADDVINDDEGFMADEVEYQDDHSINNDLGSGGLSSNILMNSGATTSTLTDSMSNMNSNRSASTGITTASPVGIFEQQNPINSSRHYSSIRECDDENENDENQDNTENNDENDYENENEIQQGTSDHSDLDMVIDE